MRGPSAAALRLCDFAARAEGIERELAGLKGRKAGLFREVRAAGFDAATLRAAVALRLERSRDPSRVEDRRDRLDLYLAFLEAHGAEGPPPVQRRPRA